MTTCKAWVPTDSGNRHCGEPATRRMFMRHDGGDCCPDHRPGGETHHE